MEFLVITGMSGAGKTQASNILEDMGYYCIDNMPSAMIPYFAELYSKMPGKTADVAFVIDVRGESDFLPLLAELDILKDSGYNCRTVFIDCEDRVLINRYKETRRVHPLVTLKNISVNEALALERKMLRPVRERADYIIDTSALTPSQLRDKLIAIQNSSRTGSGQSFFSSSHGKSVCTLFGFSKSPAIFASSLLLETPILTVKPNSS